MLQIKSRASLDTINKAFGGCCKYGQMKRFTSLTHTRIHHVVKCVL